MGNKSFACHRVLSEWNDDLLEKAIDLTGIRKFPGNVLAV